MSWQIEVMAPIPAAAEDKFRYLNMLSLVSFAGMTLKKWAEAIRTTVVPISIFIRTTAVPIRTLIRTTGM